MSLPVVVVGVVVEVDAVDAPDNVEH